MKQLGKYFLYAFGVVMLFSILSAMFDSDKEKITTTESVDTEQIKIDSIAEALLKDNIKKAEAMEVAAEAKFLKTKAGKIWKKHKDWSKEDCKLVSEGKIWIGMHYDMLVYQRGRPNHVNTSNYGAGNEYQCCWEDYNINCVYFKEEDGIITSYN